MENLLGVASERRALRKMVNRNSNVRKRYCEVDNSLKGQTLRLKCMFVRNISQKVTLAYK